MTLVNKNATAIPYGTTLGQIFNEELLEMMGDVVGNEIDIFNVNLWLTPGISINRNTQNRRNLGYYSEDPFIRGKMAAAISWSVQKHKNRATTFKKFAWNNQEMDRFNTNSLVCFLVSCT